MEIKIKGFPKPFNFPDGTPPEEIDRMVNEEILPHRDEILAHDMEQSIHEAHQKSYEDTPAIDRFLGGAGRGLRDTYEGVAQVALKAGEKMGLVNPETVQHFQEHAEGERALYDDTAHGFAAGSGRFTGTIAPFLVDPLAALADGGSLSAVSLAGAGSGLAQGALQYVPGEDPTTPMTLQRLFNAGAGGALGAAGGAGGYAMGKVLPKVVNGFAGRMNPEAQQVENLAEHFGIRRTAGDVSQSPVLQKTEQALEMVPGMRMPAYREAQAGEVKSALEGIVDKYKQGLSATDFEKLATVQKAAANGDGAAVRVMDEIQKAGGDPDAVVKASNSLKMWRAKDIARQQYDQVQNLAGKGPVQLPNTKAKVASLLRSQDSQILQTPEVKGLLQQVKSGLQSKTDFARARRFRSMLKEQIRTLDRQGKYPEKAALEQLQGSLETDLSDFAASKGGPLKTAYQKADSFYRDTVVPMRDFQRKLFNKNELDRVTDKGIDPKSAAATQKFYSSLDDKGRAAVRLKMVQSAWDKAYDEARGRVSPAKFAGQLERLQTGTGLFFRGTDRQEIQGLAKLLRHLERAGQYAENPPTGNRAAQLMVQGGAMSAGILNPLLLLKAYGAAGVSRALLTSKLGRNLLLASSKFEPGSAKFGQVLSLIERKLPALMASLRELPERAGAALPESAPSPVPAFAQDDGSEPDPTPAPQEAQ